MVTEVDFKYVKRISLDLSLGKSRSVVTFQFQCLLKETPRSIKIYALKFLAPDTYETFNEIHII